MTRWLALLLLVSGPALGEAQRVDTPYEPQQVVFDFYLDDPQKMGTALYWLRSLMNPLTQEPYGYDPEEHDIKVVIHGTEIVTVAEKNYPKYETFVERMRYYADFGVEFRVCGLAAQDYGYTATDFHDFIQLVPSAITELAHWQQQGYALITPIVHVRNQAIEDIR